MVLFKDYINIRWIFIALIRSFIKFLLVIIITVVSLCFKVIEHQEFLKRIKKTLYYGTSSSSYQCDRISRPLADYTAEMFSETHKGTSLNRLDFVTVSKLKVTPCSLILAMIYLDRLNSRDPDYARKITPSELFLVSMVRKFCSKILKLFLNK